ncbi:MAG: sigma-70 family RNA polymerase sigma factor [Candidatus Aminicenantes bacterium]|nr:sigma-70 family RNA polymerase sigma factor [Candidatus Aminicenantes bacterium]
MRPDERQEEQALIDRAKAGDVSAFEDLVRRFQGRIYRLCRRMTGTHQSADDLAQETFFKAFLALAGFKAGLDFYAWLRKIAVNATLNYLKVRRREEPLGDRDNAVPDERPPQDELQRREAEDRFQEALRALPADQRLVFTLRVAEGMSYRDIATSLRLAPGTVMSRLNRARRRLKTALADVLDGRPA